MEAAGHYSGGKDVELVGCSAMRSGGLCFERGVKLGMG